jgi:hypothetical protein
VSYHQETGLVRYLKIFGALATLLAGCSPSKPPSASVPPPGKPGVSVPLSFPILLLGTDVPNISVSKTEEQFTTTSASSGFYYADSIIIDSTGAWYDVKRATPVGDVPSVWSRMGMVQYRVFVEVKLRKKATVDEARNMVLANVRNPRNQLSSPPERLRSATAALDSYRAIAELIGGCNSQSGWLEEVRKYGKDQ